MRLALVLIVLLPVNLATLQSCATLSTLERELAARKAFLTRLSNCVSLIKETHATASGVLIHLKEIFSKRDNIPNRVHATQTGFDTLVKNITALPTEIAELDKSANSFFEPIVNAPQKSQQFLESTEVGRQYLAYTAFRKDLNASFSQAEELRKSYEDMLTKLRSDQSAPSLIKFAFGLPSLNSKAEEAYKTFTRTAEEGQNLYNAVDVPAKQ